jgi:hypothetical protein
MSGQYVADQVDSELEANGEQAVITRAGEGTVTLKVKRFGASSDDASGSSARSQFTVKAGNGKFAASAWSEKLPKRKDTILIGGRTRTIEHVDTRTQGGVTAMHILLVVG